MFKTISLVFIRGYQFFFTENRFFYRRPTCNFYPSCSHYAEVAIHMHGFLRGMNLTGKRIVRCHPYKEFSIDEVPLKYHA